MIEPPVPRGRRVLYRLYAMLIGTCARLVPMRDRARWAEEWRSELWHALAAEHTGRSFRRCGQVTRRCLGGLRDALATRRALPHHWPALSLPRPHPRDSFMHDLQIALRRLRSQPAFTLVSTLTLALGIGATTAIFSVLNGVLLRPLPYPDQDRLVSVAHTLQGETEPRQVYLSSGSYLVYRDETRTLADLAFYFPTGMNLSGNDQPIRVEAATASANFFTTLGVAPALGRGFAPAIDDDAQNTARAVISYSLWQRVFGADPEILGTTIRLDARLTEIAGVMPAGFRFPGERTELWYRSEVTVEQARNVNFAFRGLGRLAGDVTPDQAQADLDSLFERPFELFRNEGISAQALRDRGFRVRVRPLAETIVGDIGAVLWVLMAAVGMILLVACANVASLSMVRAEARERELVLQSALGASRARLVRQSLLESLLVGGLGGLLGVGLSWGGTRWLAASGSAQLPRLAEIGIHPPVLLFAALMSALSVLLFGAVPALRFRGDSIASTLQAGARPAGGSKRRRGSRNVLVAGQLALALVLLVAAGLMVRTFGNLRAVDPGFRPDNLLLFDLTLTGGDVLSEQDALAFHQQVLDALALLPEVTDVTAAVPYFGIPVANPANPNPVWVRDQLPQQGALPSSQVLRIVMPGYFETLQIPLRSGRLLDRRDLEDLTGAAVVSDSFARSQWGADNPIGKIISPLPSAGWLTVVGVVEEVSQSSLYAPPAPSVYFSPLIPAAGGGIPYTSTRPMVYAVRTMADPTAVVAQVRQTVHDLDPQLPVANVRTMQQEIARSMARTTFTMVLMGIGAGIAALLGIVGIYGAMAYVVSLRTAEIGIRMALGAQTGAIQRLVLTQAGLVIITGVSLGLAAALGLSRLLESLLFGVQPVDPATYLGVAAVLATAASVASYLPARRASRIEPVRALQGP